MKATKKNLKIREYINKFKAYRDSNELVTNKNKLILNELAINIKQFHIRIISAFIELLTIINLFYKIKNIQNRHFINLKSSNITLKIKESGNKYIFGNSFGQEYYPNYVYINGESKTVKNNYKLTEENNFIELVWDNPISTCGYMFDCCLSVTEIDLSNFDTSHITDMHYMFNGCKSLSSLNLSKFVISHVTDMNSMFSSCSSLASLDLSNFDTSQVKDMNSLFYGCSLLTSLDLSNFDISQVTDMSNMFYDCSSLDSLDLFNFNTSQVTKMSNMFYRCNSLIFLNISNFNTSQVIFMNNMFRDCSSLRILNLSNFNTIKVVYMMNMFDGCIKLEYINMKNFNENTLYYLENMFDSLPVNVVVCINENNSKILNELKTLENYTIDCSDNWKIKQETLESESDECIDNYNKVTTQNEYYEDKTTYEKITYENIINDNNNSTNITCSEPEKCLSCPSDPLFNNFCIKCNINFYPKENDSSNIGEYINCYKDPKGYYLDKNNSIYKKCFYSCEKCETKGDNITHNCLKCNGDYPYEIILDKHINCYNNCNYYHYFDDENIYHCTINASCPKEYPILLEQNMECINEDKNNVEYKSSSEFISYYSESNFFNKKNDSTNINKEETIYSSEISKEDKTIIRYENINISHFESSYITEEENRVINSYKI